MSADSPSDESSGSRFEYRQVSFVLLAALAIVLAAFFAPGVADDTGPEDPEIDTDGGGETDPDPDAGSGDGEGPDISFDWDRLLDWLDIGSDDGDGPPVEPDADDRSECVVVLDREPVPGADVTATITFQGQPLDGVPVQFNDRSVGETDQTGAVTGEVPYEEDLVVAVDADGEPNCYAEGPGAASLATAPAIGAVSSSIAIATSGIVVSPVATAVTSTTEESNSTAAYEVDGDVEIGVLDDPDPGEPIDIRATIEGAPMSDAAVSVDGASVTETDDDGTASITVPDDGTDELDVEVVRGDFAGTTTIDVLVLETTLVPDGIAPVPGSAGSVVAEIDGDPVSDATVTIDGDEHGTTDSDGALAIELPRDPTTTVTVATTDQTATVSVLGQYGGVAVVLSLLVAGTTAVAYRTHGAFGSIAVASLAGGISLALVVEAFYGPAAGLFVLALLAAIGVAARLKRAGSSVRRPAIGERTRGLGAWLVARLVAVVGLLEVGVDRLRAAASAASLWLTSVPRSATGVLAQLFGWLRSLPGRAIGPTVAWLRNRSTVQFVAVGGAVALLIGGYTVDDWTSVVLAAAILALGGALLLWRGRGAETTSDPTASETGLAGFDADSDRAQHSFRKLWRAFAREVAPGRWRKHTPGEIERQALQDGYPREPVCELTTLFREVEYGDRSLSATVRERAERAATELNRYSATTDGGQHEERSGSIGGSRTATGRSEPSAPTAPGRSEPADGRSVAAADRSETADVTTNDHQSDGTAIETTESEPERERDRP